MKTYGIQVFNQSFYEELMYNWTRPNGCKDKVQACQDSMRDKEPQFLNLLSSTKHNANRTAPCNEAAQSCSLRTWDQYQSLNNGWYDIAHPKHDPFPLPHMQGYLREESVLAALGVPVNYTAQSGVTAAAFDGTYDFIHGGFLSAVSDLLHAGVKVHLVYGDRDYACNWVGGEAASLAVPWARQDEFAEKAGYTPLLVPATQDENRDESVLEFAGLTRQLGNFSFTRVFQAGHEVPSYAPAAASAIFVRATFNRDIATGSQPLTDDLITSGPKHTWHVRHEPPVMPKPRCYVLKPGTCTPEVWDKVRRGEAVVRDWFVVEEEEAEIGEL